MGYRFTLDKSCAIPLSPHKICTSPISHQATNSSTSTAADTDTDSEAGKIVEPKVMHVSSMCVSINGCSTLHPPQTTSFPQKLKAWIIREATSCAAHSLSLTLRHPLESSSARANVGIFLNCVAGFLSFFHVLYGTVVFSALLFISNLDAIGQVMLKGLVSAIVCRFLVLVEMGEMRGTLLAANKRQ